MTKERLEEIEEFVSGCMMPPLYANELLDEIDHLRNRIEKLREALSEFAFLNWPGAIRALAQDDEAASG